MRSQILHGDSRVILRGYPDNFFDSCVCDPPYELGFMGKRWDSTGIAYDVGLWEQVLRVLKPGAHLAAFGGTRTYHRMTCAIEDSGFEIRDSLHWIYGSGFPKSLDISKAIDKLHGAERTEITGVKLGHEEFAGRKTTGHLVTPEGNTNEGWTRPWAAKEDAAERYSAKFAPATEDAAAWDGWGTALKPSHEPIVLARKPFPDTVASNVLKHGTGGLNIDATRVGDVPLVNPPAGNKPGGAAYMMSVHGMPQDAEARTVEGRWPPNVLYGHSDGCNGECVPGCPVLELNTQSGIQTSGKSSGIHLAYQGDSDTGFLRGVSSPDNQYDDTGGASRFFPCFKYNAKAASKERPRGEVAHSTVKPLELMRWLVRLVTPPEGVVLDPFAGSGTTGEACVQEGMNYVLVEKEADYIQLINDRLSQPSLFEEL